MAEPKAQSVHLTSSLAAQICFWFWGTRARPPQSRWPGRLRLHVPAPIGTVRPQLVRHTAYGTGVTGDGRPSRARALTFLVAQTGVMLAGLGLIVIHESTLLSICGVVMAVGAGGAVVAAARAYRDRPRAE